MTDEDKKLLLIDLSERLPYGVKCNALLMQIDGSLKSVFGTFNGYNGWVNVGNNNLVEIETVRPYLRPMSSMTEEEKEELSHLLPKDWSVEIDKLNNFYFDTSPSIFIEIDVFLNVIDWLNSHHFDYRGLIEKGLAIEAQEDMYK